MAETRLDAVPLRAARSPQGYLRDSPVVARTGVQTYRMGGRLVREYKPAGVYDAAALAAIQAIPLIDTHKAISAANVRDHVIGTVLSPGRLDGETVVADVVLYDDAPTKAGRKELSLAYSVEVDPTPGVTPENVAFDQRVTRITAFDHLALVERGRAGVARLRLDSDAAVSAEFDSPDGAPAETAGSLPPASTPNNRQEGQTMADPATAPVRLDSGITYQAPAEVVAAFDRLRGEAAAVADKVRADADAANRRADEAAAAATRKADEAIAAANKRADEAKARADAAEATRDAEKSRADAAEARIPAAQAEAAAAARARVALEATAKAHGVDVRADAADLEIKAAVIAKLAPGADLAGRSPEYLSARLDAELERLSTKAANGAAQAAQAAPGAVAAAAATVPTVRADAAHTPAVARSAADVARAMAAAGHA